MQCKRRRYTKINEELTSTKMHALMYLYECIIVTLLPKNLLFSLNTFIKTHVMSIHADFRFPAFFLAEFRVSWKIGFISVNSKTSILFKLCWAYFLYSADSLYSHYSVESLLSLFLFSYYYFFFFFADEKLDHY